MKISLLDKQREIDMRRRLNKNVKMYTGDDFNYAELIAGDAQGFSHALLGIFDAIAPAASYALSRLAAGDEAGFHDVLGPTVPLSRHIFKAPTRFYKTGVVFMAYLNGHQDHFTMVGGQESARSTVHLAELFRLADQAGLLANPELATRRMKAVLAIARRRGLMRDFSGDHRWLSLNTATVRKQGDLVAIVEACARHGIRAIDPWRDQVAHVGLDRAVRAVRDAGLELSGYCRGGMFTSDAARRGEVRDDNRRCVDEAWRSARPASCWWSAACRNIHGRAVPSQRTSPRRAGRSHDALGEMLDYAKQAKMPLAIEPLHPAYAADRACVNMTEQALDICDALDPGRTGALGVALDVYHIWWDPKLLAQIARAGRDRLLAFHVCDWLVPTKDILNDRGMMGDGVIDIKSIRAAVEAQGYAGYSEIEIFSNDWWAQADGRGAADLHRAAQDGGVSLLLLILVRDLQRHQPRHQVAG